jgi:cell division transport system permease protein
MSERAMTDAPRETELIMSSPPIEDGLPRNVTPIVPKNSIAGHALAAVVAIMTFLASLTAGAVMLVLSSAAEWQSDVSREMTIQVRPLPGRDMEADVAKAAQIAQATPGVTDVRPYSRAESARLLEPWLGTGLSMEDLPVPRIIVVRIAADPRPDLAGLRAALSIQLPSASLDDHRGWVDRMRAMAGTAIGGGIAILALVLTATILSVAFATRGAMATNRHIIEVLHFIGAKNAFIAGQFQGHFLVLGLQGGAVGGGAALILLALAGLFGDWFLGTAASDQSAAFFGTFAIGITGYIVVIGQVLLIGAVTALTSRRVVNQTLASFD